MGSFLHESGAHFVLAGGTLELNEETCCDCNDIFALYTRKNNLNNDNELKNQYNHPRMLIARLLLGERNKQTIANDTENALMQEEDFILNFDCRS